MFIVSSVGSFLYNRRNGLKWTGYIAGGIYLGLRYAKRRMTEALVAGQRERVEADDIVKRFDNNLQDCEFTTLALLSTLKRQLDDSLDLDTYRDELARRRPQKASAESNAGATNAGAVDDSKASAANANTKEHDTPSGGTVSDMTEGPGSKSAESAPQATEGAASSASEAAVPNNENNGAGVTGIEEIPAQGAVFELTKSELWHAIKVHSYARAIAATYLLVLVTFQTHIQLSLLGRKNYVASVRERVGDAAEAAEADITEEQLFLTLSWWLAHRGWPVLREAIESAVEDIVGEVPLKTVVVYEELPQMLTHICTRVEHALAVEKVIFPQTDAEAQECLVGGGIGAVDIPAGVRALLDESIDFAQSRDGAHVRELLVNRCLAHLTARVEPAFGPAVPGPDDSARFQDVTRNETKVVQLLPHLAEQADIILGSNPNEYVDELLGVPDLAQFSAVVFAGYDL